MTSQPAKQAIAIHTLPNISRSKGNQTMKFGQLNFLNNQNRAYLWISCLKFYTIWFYCMPV